MSAITARVAPSASDPESPMKIWAGMDVEPEERQERPDDQRAEEGQVRLRVRLVEQRHEQERDEREDERATGEAVEAVGDVDPVARRDDREGGEVM